MNRVRPLFALIFTLALAVPVLLAQDKPKPDSKLPGPTLKVQVTITETDGEKKVANLPYTFFVRAGESMVNSPWTKVRMGSRVPVYAGKEGGMQYIDVGTNIDSRAFAIDDGRFDVALNIERSWVEGNVLVPVAKPTAQDAEAHSGQFPEPVIRQFKTELNLTMRDGQSTQSTSATDPLTGKTLTITMTINVVK